MVTFSFLAWFAICCNDDDNGAADSGLLSAFSADSFYAQLCNVAMVDICGLVGCCF